MTINFDILVYTLIALIPGFIISTIIRTKIPMLARDKTFSFFSFIILSALNYFPWVWGIATLWDNRDSLTTASILLHGIFLLFIWPCIVAGVIVFVYSIVKKSKKVRILCPTAWDYKFSKIITEEYVIIILNDNTKVYAKFGINSNAASYANSHDIYLEKCYRLGDNGEWLERQGSNGIYIAASNIKLIEFIEGGS